MLELTRQQARQIDQRAAEELGMSTVLLMENAGRGAADWLCEQRITGPVLIVCGKGNNGGDGLVIARHLLVRGYNCRVALVEPADKLAPDARANWQILDRAGVPCPVVDPLDNDAWHALTEDIDWIVDALLGTGAKGSPRSPYAEWIERINSSTRKVLALDIPSGLDCDTGEPATPTIRATATVTFVAPKVGFRNPLAREHLGAVHVVDIGVPVAWLKS